MIYLDNAASTAMFPEIVDKLHIEYKKTFGNPGALFYGQAVESKELVEFARNKIAKFTGSLPENIIFTSGASESNNTVIKGICDPLFTHGKKIITTNVEHNCVTNPINYLAQIGYEVIELKVDATGKINISELENAVDEDVALVSILWVNNECATINDAEKIASIVKNKSPKTITMFDGVQSIAKIRVNIELTDIDYLTFCSHKIHGPKGAGVIVKHSQAPFFTPLIHGGIGHEFGYRGGTAAVHTIYGFGLACAEYDQSFEKIHAKVVANEQLLIEQLKEVDCEILNLHFDRVPGLLVVKFNSELNNIEMIKALKDHVAISKGSADTGNSQSRVLKALNIPEDICSKSLRISVSALNTKAELTQLADILNRALW